MPVCLLGCLHVCLLGCLPACLRACLLACLSVRALACLLHSAHSFVVTARSMLIWSSDVVSCGVFGSRMLLLLLLRLLTVHLVNSQAVFYLLSGRELVRIEVDTADDFAGILRKFKKEIWPDHRRYHVVLPTGAPLRSAMPTAKRRRLE